MRLATIEDLENNTNEDNAFFINWARELQSMYNYFIRNDKEDVSFTAGWGAASKRAAGIHASEISGCQRQVYYTLSGFDRKEDIDPFWKKRFRLGHMIHAMLQNDFKRMCENTGGAMSFEEELSVHPKLQKVAEEYGIYSHCDGVFSFFDRPGEEPIMRVMLEIKSSSPGEFETLKAPKKSHIEQSTIYMKALNVPLGWTLYYNKGNQNIMPSDSPWLFKFDHRIWDSLTQRIQDRYTDVRNHAIPKRDESMLCEFCAYSWECKPEYLQRKKNRDEAKSRRRKAANRNPHKLGI